MVYLRYGEKCLIIISPTNVEKLKKGFPLATADNMVGVAFTPDMEWFQEEIRKIADDRRPTVEEIDMLLKMGQARPEVKGT